MTARSQSTGAASCLTHRVRNQAPTSQPFDSQHCTPPPSIVGYGVLAPGQPPSIVREEVGSAAFKGGMCGYYWTILKPGETLPPPPDDHRNQCRDRESGDARAPRGEP